MVLQARILFLFFLVALSFNGMAQVSFDSQEELEKAANEFFDASDYAKAKPLFSQLLSKEALNPNYNYRFGVCILFTEADPLKPLPYIEGGANSKGVNSEAFYFLGKALQYNYRFDDAITAFQKAKNANLNKANIDLDRSIEECRNGKILYNSAIDFQPVQDKEVIASEFYRPYDFRKLKGKVIPMPLEFKTKYDQKNLKGTVIYTPTNSQTLVYASYGEDGANAKDLYRVNRLPNGELALPLRLPNTINTKYDEDYAFFDEESQVLYFASKGHNSMGGYDVFSSKYDPNTSNWSTPLNLQYPINSPYDDFLYVSDPEGKVAFFTSERNVVAGKLRVMKMLLNDPQQVEVSVLEGTFNDKTDSVYNYAALTVFDPTTNEVIGKYRSNKVSGKYLLILPPQNDYKMDVGPREANGFNFDLDVPKQESINPLRQGIVYNASGENGTITVTNYFDATGKPDSVAFAKNRSLKEIEKQMVDMPEPTEVLASAQKIRDEEKKEAELALTDKAKNDSIKQAEKMALEIQQKAAEAKLLIERAKEDSLKQIAELAIQEKNDAEEAAKQAELAMAEKEHLEAIRKAEEKALALLAQEAAAKVEKARLDSLKRAEEIASQEKARIEEAGKEAELAIAEKERLESIREAEEEALAILEKQTAAKTEKAKQDSIEVLVLRKQVAAAKRTAESLEKELVAEALAKAAVDSTREVEELEKLKASHSAERAKRDSTNQANKLAEKQALLAKAEKERVDAIREAKKEEALALIKEEAAAKAQKDSLKRAEAIALQERAQIEEAARQAELAIAEKERLATIREAENKALALLEKETKAKKARQDSLKQAEEIAPQEKAQIEEVAKEAELAQAEKERLAAIDKEVELAKQQAMRDSLIQPDELVKKPKDELVSYDEILKEMAQKETEILEKQEVLEETASQESIVVDSSSTATLAALPDTTEADSTKEPQSETETISESELFLQTIAKLEAQKNAQENLVLQENEDRKKAESDRKLAQAEAARATDTTALKISSADTQGIEMADGKADVLETDTSDIETMSVALKSDANPAEYLAALSKIEGKIAKEEEINKDKTYELKELNPKPVSDKKAIEPALQAKIDADRKALTAHQKIASEKERMLNEQMQRDRETVISVDEAAEEELAVIESEIFTELELGAEKSEKVVAVTVEVKSPVTETKPNLVENTENTSAETEVTVENSEIKEQNVSSSEQEVLDALAAFDEMLGTTKDTAMVEEQTQSELATAEKQAPALLEEETAAKDEKAKQDSLKRDEQIALQEKTKLEEAPKQAELTEAITEPELLTEEVVETPVSENVPVEIADNKQELVLPAVEDNQQPESNSAVISSSEDGVGEIPFMTAALRDYGTRSKPSFDEIENPSMRRMIKRMRSEDIGRIAVLKNMKNDWVDAGKSAESLKNIKENIRNKDVLETVASAPSREEYVRAPFDKNTLRKRKDVHYKLELGISTSGVSETISETMTPEQAISFVMPEFDLQTGYYQTLADAESDYKEYRSRGFETVRIVPYLKNEPVRLSDVAEAPFID